ncbi:glycosyltransferase family 4 protein (plasmid) [Tundrisphaera lichenicola]|uniref:glycosyltransferase family 4 protein n=1 Tax=Tundrisphaera lichenicola TaxID=2029860 RepID=UPI003EBDFE2C
MIIAYLLNMYPRPAQVPMRREIVAMDELGLNVDRYTLRATEDELVDPTDIAEREKTRAVLGVGKIGLLKAVAGNLIARPSAFVRAMTQAIRMGRRSERGTLLHLIYLAEACVLRGWLVERGTTHLHCHYGTNSATVALLSRFLGGPPYSFTMHGPEEFDSPRALSLRDKIHHAEFVSAISEFTRSQLFRWADHADWPKIHIIHCGADATFLGAERTPIPDVPRLVNVGRLAEQKGQLLLIEAAARLIGEGVDCEVVIVGDGPMRGQAERLIDDLGVRGKVRITGYLSNLEVRREIEASRALVLPSFAEGLPTVFMESLALGRPVIGTYIAGAPELVEPGACGWLVPAGSVDALVKAMRETLTTPIEDLERMGREGARRVAESHNSLTEARKLSELFEASARRH